MPIALLERLLKTGYCIWRITDKAGYLFDLNELSCGGMRWTDSV